jgi:hypothetical protein
MHGREMNLADNITQLSFLTRNNPLEEVNGNENQVSPWGKRAVDA